MSYLTVKNWKKHQHYKDRTPPWIKLATDTFQDYEFACLQDASKLLAICSWTLASKCKDGKIPHDFEYIKRQSNLGDMVKEEHLNELINKGFLVSASNMLAECKQSARPETETETETEVKENTSNEVLKKKFVLPGWINETDWLDYCEMRIKIRKPMTERAKQLAVDKLWQLKQDGHDPAMVLQQSVVNSWQGLFEIKEVKNGSKTRNNGGGWLEEGRRLTEHYMREIERERQAEIGAITSVDSSNLELVQPEAIGFTGSG